MTSGAIAGLAMSRRTGAVALVAATAFWGSTVAMIKIASEGSTALAVTVVEVSSAAISLLLVCWLRGVRLPRPSWRLVLPGLVEPGLAYLLLNVGITRTSGTHAAVLIGAESVLVVVFASVADRAAPARAAIAGLALAVIGAALVTDSGGGAASLTGDLIVLAGVAASAAYVPLASRLTSEVAALPATTYQMLSGVAVILPIAGQQALRTGWNALVPDDDRSWLVAVAAGVLGSAVAFLLYNWALARVTPVLAGTALTMIPAFGVLAAVVLLGDHLMLGTAAAVAIVVLGVVIAGLGDLGEPRVRDLTVDSSEHVPSRLPGSRSDRWFARPR